MPGCISEADRRNVDAAYKRYLLALDYVHRGMIPAAEEELRRALEFDPKHADSLYLWGYIAMHKAVETEDFATRVQCLPKDEARVQLEDVDRLMRTASERFRQALAVRADYSEAWNGLAAVSRHFKRWDEVITQTTRALQNATYSTPWLALLNQGVAYLEKKDLLRAGKVLREALQQNPKFCIARWRLGQVYNAQGQRERARQELQLLLEDRNCPIQEAYLLLGKILLAMNESTRAEDVFQQCRRLAPDSCVAKECRLAD
jgi:Tfp pilus assembly protein PilF